jgi:hypothetical protein
LSEQRKYRSWTAQQKIEIVLAGLRGDRTVKDVCREHEISDTLFTRSRTRSSTPGATSCSRAAARRWPGRRTETEGVRFSVWAVHSGSRSPKWILNASRAVVQFRVRVHAGTALVIPR